MDYEAHEDGAFNMGIRITHDNGPPIEESRSWSSSSTWMNPPRSP